MTWASGPCEDRSHGPEARVTGDFHAPAINNRHPSPSATVHPLWIDSAVPVIFPCLIGVSALIKVAMIGAGSVVFSKNLTGDILSYPEFRDATFSYMDIDPRAA